METKHHRRPRRLGGLTVPSNISHVSDKCHSAWHQLFNHMEAFDICDLINKIWLDPKYKFVCVEREPNGSGNDGSDENKQVKPKKYFADDRVKSHYRDKLNGREILPTQFDNEKPASSHEPFCYDIMAHKVSVRNGHWFFTKNNADKSTP